MSELIDNYLDDLALFVRVVETGGFSAAFRLTGTPQGTISRRIAALEKHLGLTLINRTTRSIELTEPGRRVYEHARLMLDQAEAATHTLEKMQSEPVGELRVSAPIIIGQHFVSDALGIFMARYPKVLVNVEWTTRSIHPMEDGVDVAIKIGQLPDSGLVRTRLGHTHRALFTAPELALSDAITHPADLAQHSVFSLGNHLDDTTLTFRFGERTESVSVSRAMASNDVAPLVAASRARGGVAVLPDFAAPPGWIRLLPDWEMPSIEINAVSLPTRGALPRLRAFLEVLREEATGRIDP